MSPESAEHNVKIFTTPLCGYCMMAKRLLMSRGASFEEVDTSGDQAMRSWLITQTGQRTVPQIFIHGQSIGGYTELNALDRAGELTNMVNQSR